MSDKMTCPACDSYTSSILQAYEDGSRCPVCGIPAEVTVAVLEARKRNADADLTERYEAAEIRAGRAEAEARKLRRHLDAIKYAVDHPPEDSPWA